MQTDKLIDSLAMQVKDIILRVETLKDKDISFLQWREHDTSWNILECLEHLNLYGDFYLPEIKNKILNSNTKSESEFRSGMIGNYFAKSMLPKQKLNKMKTFNDKNPINKNLDKNVINRFIDQQHILIDLLNESKNTSLNKVKISTSISRLIKIKLGDTFQFLVNHILRHLQQIEKIKAQMQK